MCGREIAFLLEPFSSTQLSYGIPTLRVVHVARRVCVFGKRSRVAVTVNKLHLNRSLSLSLSQGEFAKCLPVVAAVT